MRMIIPFLAWVGDSLSGDPRIRQPNLIARCRPLDSLDSPIVQPQNQIAQLIRLVPAMRDVQDRDADFLRQAFEQLNHAIARLLIERT
jgi:hypothetical protein